VNTIINRREFLGAISSLVVGSIITVPLLSGCATTGFVSYATKANNGTVILDVSHFPELKEIGNAIQINVENISEEIILVRKSENDFTALSPICTHLGCSVKKENTFLRCPCHGSTYSLAGNVVRGPAEKPLTSYHTDFSNGTITIYL